jgi:hypothetical protein
MPEPRQTHVQVAKNYLNPRRTQKKRKETVSSDENFSMNRHYCTVPTVADPHHVDAYPDPAFHFDAAPDPDSTFHSDADPDPTFQYDADPKPTSHFSPDLDPPMLQNDPLRLPLFYFNADTDTDPDPAFHFDGDPDLAFHFDADPDPASHNDADPCGSGSATLTIPVSSEPVTST